MSTLEVAEREYRANNSFFLQVLYDAQWVENVWSYTMPELLDPTIGDAW